MSKRQTDYFPFEGGLDVVSPAIKMPPGIMIGGMNMEPWINKGYRRIKGFERFDGMPKPSDATFSYLPLVAAMPTAVVGDPHLTSVISLLNFDGMADGTTITDFVAGNVWTVAADAAVASGELVLDGTGDEVLRTESVPFREAFNGTFGNQWTMEYRVRLGQVVAQANIIDWRNGDTTQGMLIEQSTADPNKITVHIGDAAGGWEASIQSTSTFSATDVVEIALTRNLDVYTLHIDGVYEATATTAVALDLGTGGLLLGGVVAGANNRFTGDFIRARFTSGVARYTISVNYTIESVPSYYEVEAVGTVAGDTVSGQTSGATGVVISVSTDLDVIYVTKVVGAFASAELVDNDTTGALGIGTTTVVADEYAPTIAEEEAIGLLAENEYRDDIPQVPGSGPIRGIWQNGEFIYCFRDNPGATACIPYVSTATGWDSSLMVFAHYFYFDSGSALPTIGDELEGASSGATADVHQVILHTGSWSGDAAGYVLLLNVVGTFSSGENITNNTTVSVNDMTTTTVSTQFSLPDGGKYEFTLENFYGGSNTTRVYCAPGTTAGFEICEFHVISPILWDLSAGDLPGENKPYLVEGFNGSLWFAFVGGSVQSSVVGNPLAWNGFLGAAEYGLQEEITSIRRSPGDILVARTRRHTHGFYKDGSGGYILKVISDRAGGIIYSAQELDTAYAIDDAGMTDLRRVETFGDFASATISDKVQPILQANKEVIAGSMVVRNSNQYRVLFENGDGVICRIVPGGKPEFGVISMGVTVNVAYSCVDTNGAPTNYFGGDEGYVYQAEIGKNFDGEVIESFIRLPFSHQGRPAWRKRYRLADIELEAQRAVTLLVSSELSYGNTETGDYNWNDSVIGGGGFYDLDNWDEIYWDAQTFSTARVELLGTGQNISLLIYNSSATINPFILQGLTLHFDMRRVRR